MDRLIFITVIALSAIATINFLVWLIDTYPVTVGVTVTIIVSVGMYRIYKDVKNNQIP